MYVCTYVVTKYEVKRKSQLEIRTDSSPESVTDAMDNDVCVCVCLWYLCMSACMYFGANLNTVNSITLKLGSSN